MSQLMMLDMGLPPICRRPFLLAIAGGSAAVGVLGVTARTGLLDGELQRGEGRLELSSGELGVRSLEVPLDDSLLTRSGAREWVSASRETAPFSMVGFTWRRGDAEPHLEVSPRVGGVWRGWQQMPHAHAGPDPDSDEGADTAGTDLAWVGDCDGFRLRVGGHRPAGLALVLIHPTALPGDRPAEEGVAAAARTRSADSASRGRRRGRVPRPALRTRRDWGADRSWRDGAPRYNDTIKQVHVHHTVNSNDYARSDVPAMIRGMYRYHTHNLGWSDIGYNFLVDRFGRVWIGRAGGAGKAVRGAHTLGFNATSTGVAVIGNHETARTTKAARRAIARVAAWKLDTYDRDPTGGTRVRSEGSDKYPEGRRATLPVIDGHRDTNATACPGEHLYADLPRIRRRTKRRMRRFARSR